MDRYKDTGIVKEQTISGMSADNWKAMYNAFYTDKEGLGLSPNQEYLDKVADVLTCLLYTSPSPRDYGESRMPSSA